LRDRFPRLFNGEFETGNYPDEWYWREGISRPEATRHMSNAWKADLTVARLALSQDLARAAAQLAGWPGAQLGQDTIWWKPPATAAIAYHQDSSFMDFLDPPETITCWITLDDTEAGAGTLEYAAGSHRWPLTPLPENFHAPDDYRAQMHAAAAAAHVRPPVPVAIVVPAGSCVFHSGRIWHGSGPNRSADRPRRAIGVHFLKAPATFSDRPGGYIYRRYKRPGDRSLDESCFPLLFSEDGRRTGWTDEYCRGTTPLGGRD
jgi:ectoine hydroxylase-related dioxygenase (phytanoyl-CoA dioxygenase family)